MLLIALSMVRGSASRQHAPTHSESADIADGDAEDVAIHPLTIPLLVGPGTIASMIVLGQDVFAHGLEISLAIGLGAFLILLSAALSAAPLIGHYLSGKVTAITRRLMGMILAAIAMQMILTGLRVFFGSPA